MNKIEEIEQFIKKWEANKTDPKTYDMDYYKHCIGIIDGLKLALGVFKRPSNTAMQIDEETCSELWHCLRSDEGDNYCSRCGKSLHD